MSDPKSTSAAVFLADDLLAVPIHPADAGVSLRLCVLLKRPPAQAPSFLLLRDLPEARVYLGCVCDQGGRVREWVELHVQDVSGLQDALPACREAISNATLDEVWGKRVRHSLALSGLDALVTGWESVHPPPTFVDLDSLECRPLEGGAGAGRWELCVIDRVLEQAGLPPYQTSLVRYLHQPDEESSKRFVPVCPAAPENASTTPLDSVLGSRRHVLPFNPQGGLLFVTRHHPYGLEPYLGLLGAGVGGSEPAMPASPAPMVAAGLLAESALDKPRDLFLLPPTPTHRLLESFHLKLRLLLQMFGAVRGRVQADQLPLLNLAPDSFRVSLGEPRAGVPRLWSARCVLARPSQGHVLQLPGTDHRYYVRLGAASPHIYLPERVGTHIGGMGEVTLRRVGEDGGATVIEGTLSIQEIRREQTAASPNDLLWVRLPLPGGRLDVYGHLYASESLASRRVKFRSEPQRLAKDVVEQMRAREGAPFPPAPYEVLPQLSSPCDLYALAVLAVKTLLVDEKNTLPMALDDLLGLAAQLALDAGSELPLPDRVRALFEQDPRWVESLGPQHLTADAWPSKAAFDVVPAVLWYETLAWLVRLLPGLGPFSVCRDYGDVPALALEKVFEVPALELEKLVVRSQSLIILDWTLNRELQTVIGQFATPA